jgi:hypothetical protein
MQIVEEIRRNLDWLSVHAKSPDITNISIVLAKLNIQAVTLGDLKSDAYDVLVDLEDDYKSAMAEKVNELIRGGLGVAAAERQAEAELKSKRNDWKRAEKTFQRLRTFLDRLDKVSDAVRQRVSVEKQTGLKNMSGT